MSTSASKRPQPARYILVEDEAATAPGQVVPFNLPQHLLCKAIEGNASLDLVDRLLALVERDGANQARLAFLSAMAAFKAACPSSVEKTGYSADGGYTHAVLADITNHINEHAAANGLTYDWEYDQAGHSLEVTCVVSHTGGHEKRVTLRATPSNGDTPNPAHAMASLITYFQRYTLQSAFGISTREKDEEARAVNGSDVQIEVRTREGRQEPAPEVVAKPPAADLPARQAAPEVSDVIAREVDVTPKISQPAGLPVIPDRVLNRNLQDMADQIRKGEKTLEQVIARFGGVYLFDDRAMKLVLAAANATQVLEAA